jgi:Ca-activated chloride channel family protein
MYARDVEPTRLTRAKQKIVDILRQRREGYTALVAWAGSAHAVTPLTDDTETIENLLESLEPAMMPVPGSRPGSALETIQELFANAHLGQGRILFVTDGIDDLGDVTDQRNRSFPISVLGVGTPDGGSIPLDFVEQPGRFLTTQEGEVITARLDDARLREAAELSYGHYARMELGDSDLATVLGTTLPGEDSREALEREFDLWHDLGYWFAVLALPLLLFGFRKGILATMLFVVLPQDARADWWDDLWQRDDQQAFIALRGGEPERAATVTDRPEWRGVAEYRAGNYASAVNTLKEETGIRDTYNRANALARLRDFDAAVAAYDDVLAREPEHADAAHNKALIEKLRDEQQKADSEDNQENQQESDNQSDSQRQGENDGNPEPQEGQDSEGRNDAQESQPGEQPSESEQGEAGQPEEGQEERESMSRQEKAEALEQWLRRVPDDPGGLMRRKFQYENDQRLREGDYRYRRGDKIW